MNTKGIKFLAVLAVMAMAFAAFAVVMTADNDDATVVYNQDGVKTNPKSITATTVETTFYISEDTTVKIKGQANNLLFLVQNGKILELDFKADPASGKKVTIKTVTGDQEFTTSSTSTFNGKYVDDTTEFTFVGEKGMSTYYKAASASYSVSYDVDNAKFKYTYSINGYAQASSDKEFASGVVVAGSNLAVANGQTIVVQNDGSAPAAISNLVYGVMYSSIYNTKYTDTYYSPYSNAGDIAMDDGETVIINSGSANITTSGSSVKASGVSGPITVVGGSVLGGFDVTGDVYAGSITLNGQISSASASPGLTIYDGASVTISNKTEITDASTIKNDGELILKTGQESVSNLTVTGTDGSHTGVLVLQNAKLWVADPMDPDTMTIPVTVDSTFDGLIDSSAISTTYYGEVGIATATIARDQTYSMDGNTTIKRVVSIEGIMVVSPGVTLTLDNDAKITMVGQYSQIINNGKIIVKAGADGKGLLATAGRVINNGTISFEAKSLADPRVNETFVTGGINFINNGSVSISRADYVTLQNFTNYGTLIIGGTVLNETTIDNYGRISYNNAVIGDNTTSVLSSVDAVVTISSVKMTADGGVFAVSNSNMYKTDYSGTGVSSVVISAEDVSVANFTVGGATFSGSYVGKNPAIDLQGSFAATVPAGVTKNVLFALYGDSSKAGDFSVNNSFGISSKSVTVVIDDTNKAKLNVPGIVNINKDAKGMNAAKLTMTVTGRVVDSADALNGCEYEAAKYSMSSGGSVYTTLKNAIEEAYLSDIMTVDFGKITVTEDIVIPAGMTVSDNGTGKTLTIGSSKASPVIYVEDTARLSAGHYNIVNGTLFTEDSTGVDDEAVFAHVRTEEGDSVTYQSLNVALAQASSGDLIELYKPYVLSSGSVTIPEGVTVDATANNVDVVFIGSNLTVNGTFIVEKFYYIATTSEEIGVTVSGFLKDAGSTEIRDHWFTPVGVSYYESTYDPRGDEVTYFVITSLDHLQDAVDTADEKKVNVEGKAKLGDVSIKGDEDEPAEVTFKDDISAGTITLDNAIIIAKPGKQISATFADEYGAITLRGAYVAEGNKDVNIYSLGEQGVYISGPVTDIEDGTYSILFTGKTGMYNAIIGWGNYDAEDTPMMYPTITFAGETLVTGNKNQILNTETYEDPTNEDADIVTIIGAVIVDNGSKLLIVSDVDVLGTLEAKDRTSTSTNGTVEVEGNIFLGVTKASVYNAKAVIDAYNNLTEQNVDYAIYGHVPTATLGTATLSGKIELHEDMFITKAPGSNIDDEIIDDMKSMDILIDGKVWLTIYGLKQYSMDGLTPHITDCTVDAIYDANGDKLADYSAIYGVIYNCQPLDLEATGVVYIDLDYKIFTVLIKTDASIKAVYIDDILTYTGNEENQFFLYRVEAGTHTVAVEPATDYNADKAYLYDESGKKLSGLKFTFNQNDCIWVDVPLDPDGGYYEVIYNVAGTEKIVDPEPLPPEQVSEWTVTTILLLVLVILIAVMAVIVALRLNRS